jgi:ATP-binding cassette subfamily B protein RaxB
MIAGYYGHETTLATLRRRFSNSLKGINLTRIIEIAYTLNLEGRALRAELEYLSEAECPCILHWNLNHFVVMKRATKKGVEIYDPALGRYFMPLHEVSKHFTGIVLEIKPAARFVPLREKERISLRSLTGRIIGLKRALLQVFGITIAIEFLALLLPIQVQWTVDQVLPSADNHLLVVSALGFAFAMLLQTLFTVARAWVISWFGVSVNAQWVTNLFGHLLRLPIDFFEKRHMGDIVSRFSSIHVIQQTLTGTFVEAILDGLVGLMTFVILCVYSYKLTLCVLVSICAYALVRIALYSKLRRVNEEQLIYGARQQSELMESVRGIQTIKLSNKQAVRRARLENATLDVASRDMVGQRAVLIFSALNHCLFGLQRITLIALGAYYTMGGTFTAGMLVAFVAYADQFASKVGSLIDKLMDFRLLGVHMERIADIALSSPEANAQGSYSGPRPVPRIEVSNLSFRYSDADPWVLRDINLCVGPGEGVAIIGPSGCGKSTLAKLIVGLLVPTEGIIRVGGIDIKSFGLDNYREMIGAVMQEDQLFAGSIADNITFGSRDPGSTIEAITAAAQAASVDDDIMSMPMGYETYVGDMGSSLSGGQKQRVMLARALFRKPVILVLDEATSHLDADREQRINAVVRQMHATRIIVAHRQETIRSADRIIDLSLIGRSSDKETSNRVEQLLRG